MAKKRLGALVAFVALGLALMLSQRQGIQSQGLAAVTVPAGLWS